MEEAIKTLEVMTKLAKTIPVLGAPVEGALEILGMMLQHAQEVKSNKGKTRELAQQATRWFGEVVNAIEAVKDKPEDLSRLKSQLGEILKVMKDIEKAVRRWMNQSSMRRVLQKTSTSEEIDNLRTRLEDAQKRFMLASQIRLEQSQVQMSKSMDAVLSSAEKNELLSLQPVTSARYNAKDVSVMACLNGTRTELLQRLLDWAAEPTTNFTIYWIAGLAGTGKSSIAMSFCQEMARKNDVLIATFFASRKGPSDHRDAYRAIHTIVYELAFHNFVISEHVLKGIRSDADVKQLSMTEQIQRLLIAPLTAAQANASLPVILVIDALDECDKINGARAGTLIRDMAQGLSALPVKLIVTSRPEEPLRKMFHKLPNRTTYFLHETALDEVAADVNSLLVAGFTAIISKHSMKSLHWPSHADLTELVQRTGHLFIYATTLLKYVGDERHDPEIRLQGVLSHKKPDRIGKHTPYAEVDSLYMDILLAASCDTEDELDEELSQRLSTMLGRLALLYEPITVRTLAALHGDPDREREVKRDAQALTAVLLIGEDNIIRVFHESFRDFLLDSTRCNIPHFAIDAEYQHCHLTVQCLNVLNQTLMQDICDIRDPSISNAQITNPVLSERLNQTTTELIRYASRFCFAHLSHCVRASPEIIAALLLFTREHLLHWLELLSLLDALVFASRYLPAAIQWCLDHTQISGELSDARQALSDVHQTLIAYRPPLITHALQVYQSVFTTMPQGPLLDQALPTSTSPKLISQRSSAWSASRLPVVMTGHEDAVQSAVFSPDGSQVVSGSKDGTVRVWDALTGRQVTAFEDQTTGSINCVDLLSDGMEIVLGSDDGNVRLWRYDDGTQLAMLVGHTAPVNTVTVSPDGFSIASGSDDRTVRIWNVRTRTQMAVLGGHEQRVRTVVFSRGSNIVMSESEDGYVRRWATEDRNVEYRRQWYEAGRKKSLSAAYHAGAHGSFPTQAPHEFGLGHEEAGLWKSHTRGIDGHGNSSHSVAFSPDCSQVVCGTDEDSTVRLWDVRTGQQLVALDGHSDGILSLAFSHDGQRIVSASCDQTLRIWDTEMGRNRFLNEGQVPDAKVLCASLSPDGLQIATGMGNGSTQLWNAVTGSPQSTLKSEEHDSPVYRIWYSSDNSTLLTSTWFGEIMTWDLSSGKQLAVIERSCHEAMFAVAFSFDSFMIATGSTGGNIQMWNTVTGQHVVSSRDPDNQSYTVESVAFSPDNARVVAGGYGALRVCDASTGEHVVSLASGRSSYSTAVAVSFSSDGHHIVSGQVTPEFIGMVILWDSVSGHCLRQWHCEFDQLKSIAFSSDGAHVLARSHENQLCAWALSDDEATHPAFLPSLGWQRSSGWIVRYTTTGGAVPICWIPGELRGEPGWNPFCVNSNAIAIGGMNGHLTMINFPDS